jgi:hypothetical protein
MKFKTVNWITNKKSSSYKPQAASHKLQATEAASFKRQAKKATSHKLQATSNKRLDS